MSTHISSIIAMAAVLRLPPLLLESRFAFLFRSEKVPKGPVLDCFMTATVISNGPADNVELMQVGEKTWNLIRFT